MARIAVTVEDLHKAYGTKVLLDGISLRIEEGQRIGVVGRNGCGKSTFCRILLGLEEADSGHVALRDGLRLGYLEQTDPFRPGETAMAYLERVSGQPDWRCGEVAGGFEIGPAALAQEPGSLSGGWQTRLRLAGMLAREPGFLVLDEPTNYLDLKTVLLLEEFLSGFRGGWLLVSHDREFLRRTCDRTLAVDGGQAELYPGNIDAWVDYHAAQRKHAEAVNANVETRRRQLEEFIARNRARASTAARAQSKMKELAKLETVDIRRSGAEVAIRLPSVETRTGSALRADGLAIGYPQRTVAQGIDLDLDRGSHVAVLGDNGQGKSTFLKTVAGTLPTLGGALRWGHGIRIGHYAQHVYAAIPGTETAWTHLRRMANLAPGSTIPDQDILDLAGGFLFHGDDIQKPVAVLSGGERARLCLAGLLLARYEALLLDEPTNHLDFATVEALAEALAGFDGTVFFTSHDRAFVKTVATHVLEVRDGRIALYGDGYDAYVWRLMREAHDARTAAPAPAPAGGRAAAAPAARGDGRQVRQRLRQVERDLAKCDARKRELESAIAADPTRWQEAKELTEVQQRIGALEEEWLALSEQAPD